MEGLDDYAGYQLRVLAKNENYIAQRVVDGRHGEVLAVTPDLICIIDSDNGQYEQGVDGHYNQVSHIIILPTSAADQITTQ